MIKLMVIERSRYWDAAAVLHYSLNIATIGSLWIELFLNDTQVAVLESAGIHTRLAR